MLRWPALISKALTHLRPAWLADSGLTIGWFMQNLGTKHIVFFNTHLPYLRIQIYVFHFTLIYKHLKHSFPKGQASMEI